MAEDRVLFSLHVEEREDGFYIVSGSKDAIGPYETQEKAMDDAFAMIQRIATSAIEEALK